MLITCQRCSFDSLKESFLLSEFGLTPGPTGVNPSPPDGTYNPSREFWFWPGALLKLLQLRQSSSQKDAPPTEG